MPPLDFTVLNTAVPKIHKDEESKRDGSNTSRSVFERDSFRVFSQKHHNGEDFNMNNYPELMRMREDAIKFREVEESKLLSKMYKTKQMSPRTYN